MPTAPIITQATFYNMHTRTASDNSRYIRDVKSSKYVRFRSSCPSIPMTRLIPLIPRSDSILLSCMKDFVNGSTPRSVMRELTSIYSVEEPKADDGFENIRLRLTRQSTDRKLRTCLLLVVSMDAYDLLTDFVALAADLELFRVIFDSNHHVARKYAMPHSNRAAENRRH